MDQERYDTLYSILLAEGYTPEAVEQMLDLWEANEQAGMLEGDFDYAAELQGAPTPVGRQAGRMYVAAHPLEFLSTGLTRTAGALQRRRAQTRQDEILDRIMQNRRSIFGLSGPQQAAAQKVAAARGEPTGARYYGGVSGETTAYGPPPAMSPMSQPPLDVLNQLKLHRHFQR